MNIANKERLIVALDVPTAQQARELVEVIGAHACFYKVGMELFLAGDAFALIEYLAARDLKIFLDLKLFDVPATVARAIKRLGGRGITFTTVHGNDAMMRAATSAAGDELKVLAVTALTSLDQGDLNDLGFACDIKQLVVSRARRALQYGCAGVIASPREARAVRDVVGDGFVIVTPGIRPLINNEDGDANDNTTSTTTSSDDQKRISSPLRAFANGADYIVVGRPIRDATEPAVAAQNIQRQIATHFGEHGRQGR